jgi:very-short-patch-repair endonuclease
MRKSKVRVCPVCNKEFVKPGVKNPKYCSRECYEEYRKKKDIPCAHCGEIITHNDRGDRKYCSRECFAASQVITGIEERPCKWCGKMFLNRRNFKAKFCCNECHFAYKAKDNIYLICPVCGKEFKYKCRKIKFCSQQCYMRSATKATTCLEKQLYDYLDGISIVYEKQKRISRHIIPDAYIPSLDLCVYADGEYWHRNRVERDAKINNFVTEKGLLYVRLKEIGTDLLGLRPLQQFLLQNYKV